MYLPSPALNKLSREILACSSRAIFVFPCTSSLHLFPSLILARKRAWQCQSRMQIQQAVQRGRIALCLRPAALDFRSWVVPVTLAGHQDCNLAYKRPFFAKRYTSSATTSLSLHRPAVKPYRRDTSQAWSSSLKHALNLTRCRQLWKQLL
jgi:hypothetical protein